MSTSPSVTELLARAADGDQGALDRALPFVYEELHRLARRQLRRESAGHTLGTTALVHEAYLRLVDQRQAEWQSRAHFLALAATAMRRILLDHARRRGAVRRGAAGRPVPLDAPEAMHALSLDARADVLLELDEALVRLSALDARQARVVECRFFGGLTEEETAAALGVSVRTAKRDWQKARAWLHGALQPEPAI